MLMAPCLLLLFGVNFKLLKYFKKAIENKRRFVIQHAQLKTIPVSQRTNNIRAISTSIQLLYRNAKNDFAYSILKNNVNYCLIKEIHPIELEEKDLYLSKTEQITFNAI